MLDPPFTVAQFFAIFVKYNEAIWPLQIVVYGLGGLAVIALWLSVPLASRVILSVLAIMWALNGIGYHFLYFAEITPIAKVFASFFLLLPPWLRRHPLFGYFALTFGISWGGILIVLIAMGFDFSTPKPTELGIPFGFMLLGPSVSAGR
jgi:hypothetical protein